MGYGTVPQRVRRRQVTRATAALPATGQAAIFRVGGGPIRVLALRGRFTAAADATVTNLTVVANPATGADVNLSAALAIASLAAGLVLALAGTVGGAIATGAGGVVAYPANAIEVPVGTIDLLTSATNAAARIAWTIDYEAVDGRGTVTVG